MYSWTSQAKVCTAIKPSQSTTAESMVSKPGRRDKKCNGILHEHLSLLKAFLIVLHIIYIVSAWIMVIEWVGFSFGIFFFSFFFRGGAIWFLPPARFWKTAGGIVLGSVAISAVSADVLPYISVAIKASFLKLGMCNICKNNIAKMFLDFFKI